METNFKNRNAAALLSLVVIGGALLRFHNLGERQLWLDEIIQLLRWSHPTLRERLVDIMREIAAAPLDYMVQDLFVSRWGNAPFVARLHAAIFGVLSLPMIYLTSRVLFSRNVSLLATFLLSIYPLHHYYSQEGRNYSLFVFLSLCSTFFFLRAVTSARPIYWLPFTLAAALSLYTNYFAGLVLLAQGCFLLCLTSEAVGGSLAVRSTTPSRRSLLLFGVSAGVALASFLPWLIRTLDSTKADAISIFSEPGLFIRIFKEFSGGSYVLSLVLFACFFLGLRQLDARKKWAESSFLLCSVLVPILAVLFLDWYRRYFLSIRQILFTTPFFLVGVAIGIVHIPSLFQRETTGRRVRLLVVLLAATLSIGTIYLRAPKEQADWLGLVEHLRAHVREGDLIVAPNIDSVVAYYYPEINRRKVDLGKILALAHQRDRGGRFQHRLFLIKSTYLSPQQTDAMERLVSAASARVVGYTRLKGFEIYSITIGGAGGAASRGGAAGRPCSSRKAKATAQAETGSVNTSPT